MHDRLHTLPYTRIDHCHAANWQYEWKGHLSSFTLLAKPRKAYLSISSLALQTSLVVHLQQKRFKRIMMHDAISSFSLWLVFCKKIRISKSWFFSHHQSAWCPQRQGACSLRSLTLLSFSESNFTRKVPPKDRLLSQSNRICTRINYSVSFTV